MSGATQPPDPTGFAFLVNVGFDATKYKNAVSVKKGEHGKVLGRDSSRQGWLKVGVVDVKGTRFGFVPASAVTIGTVPFDDIASYKTDVLLRQTDSTTPPTFNHPLARALSALITELRNNEFGKFLKPGFKIKTSNVKKIVEIIMEGVKDACPKFIDVFQQPHIDPKDIIRHGHNLHDSLLEKTHGGIYLRLYEFEGENDMIVYTGMTQDLNSRCSSWTADIAEGRIGQEHLNCAREAEKMHMIPICFLDDTKAGVDNELRRIVENLFILLFKTYSGRLLAGRLDLDTVSDDVNDPTVAFRGASWLLAFADAAQLFTKTCERAMQTVNWRPLANVHDGLNISSPFTETSFVKTVWSRTVFPGGRGMIFRRPAKALTRVGELLIIWKKNLYGVGNRGITLSLSTKTPGAIPEKGDMVSLVVEIMTDGRAHPFAWARTPAIGIWSDWTESRSIAFRAEWYKDNKYYTRFIQCQDPAILLDKNVPGSNRGYAIAIGLVRYFKQQSVHHAPAWLPSYGIAEVRDVTFNILMRQISIQVLPPAMDNKTSAPKRKKDREIEEELKKAGVERVGGEFGKPFPQFPTKKGPMRTTCDAHYLGAKFGVSRPQPACQKEPGTTQCAYVLSWGMPASWSQNNLLVTTEDAITPRGRSVLAAVCVPRYDADASEISDPEILGGLSITGGDDSD